MRFHDIRHTCATLLRCADQKSVAPGSPDLVRSEIYLSLSYFAFASVHRGESTLQWN